MLAMMLVLVLLGNLAAMAQREQSGKARSSGAQKTSASKTMPYRSVKWGFCAAFPSGWKAEELFSGDLLQATNPGMKVSVITLGAFNNNNEEGRKPKSLEDVAEDAEDHLRDQMVKELAAKNEPTRVAGLPALITRQSYFEHGQPWRAKELRVQRGDGVVVELVLRAQAGAFEQLEKSFGEMIAKAFRPACDGSQ